MKTIAHLLPSRWASYLVNNDSSSLETEEVTNIQQWMLREKLGSCLMLEGDSQFSWTNDGPTGDVGDDCSTFIFPAL